MEYGILLFKGIINTIIRMIPLSLYMGSLMSSLMFDNKKANILLFGFILIEGLSGAFKTVTNASTNEQCALIKSETSNISMPAPIPTSIGFLVSFFISDMMYTEKIKPVKLYGLVFFLLITIWSRVNVGCHSVIDSLLASIIGIILGVGYYNVVKKYYNDLQYENLRPDDITDNEARIYKILDLS
jgi:hypothetical protein